MFGLLLSAAFLSPLALGNGNSSCANDSARQELRQFLLSDEEIDSQRCAMSLKAKADRYRDREGRQRSCCREFWRNQREETENYLSRRAEACARPVALAATSSCAEGASQAQCLESNRQLYLSAGRSEEGLARSADLAERKAERLAACSERAEATYERDQRSIQQALQKAPTAPDQARILASEGI
jgi:hypothetical protein